MKKISLYILLVLIFSNFASITKAKEIEVFCLVKNYHLESSTINPKDYERFAGKIINLLIDTNKKKIFNNSIDSEMYLMTGIDVPIKYRKSGDFINYRNKIKVGDKKTKYEYRVKIKLFQDNFPERLEAKVLQSGFSTQKWEFQIDCKNVTYTEKEIETAKIFKSKEKEKDKLIKMNKKYLKKTKEN